MNMTFAQKLHAYLGMSKRNILMFFKDKTTLLFSMIAPLIVLFLYVVFLKDTYVNSLTNELGALKEVVNLGDIDNLTNAWLLSGVLATGCVTVAMNSLTIMVGDKVKKIDFDYNSSPISGPIIVLAYFTGAFINTLLITEGILTIGLIVISITGHLYLSVLSIVMLYLLTILGSASATILMMLVASFFRSTSAVGAFSGIVSAAVGFVIGAYIPLGNYSKTIQGFLNLFPGSHVASLYRNLLMEGILGNINTSIAGADGGQFVASCRDLFGFKLSIFSWETTMLTMCYYVLGMIVLCLLINIALYRVTMKRK